ncbi:MAG TPA: LysE family transporter [Candidatus Methanoperedens sp.]
MTILEMLIIGFTVGLTGAIPPGPMLFATIESSLKIGWTAGPKLVLGHAVLEFAICIFIILGLITIIDDNMIKAISLAGGVSLCIFGGLILINRNKAQMKTAGDTSFSGPAIAGIVTSASNPYFWIWWFSAGSGLIMEGLKTGFTAAGFFITGHLLADVGWYMLVSISVSRGRMLLSPGNYRHILTACGLFLIVFGLLFVIAHQNI